MDITYSCSHALQQNRQRGSDSGVLDFASWNCVRIRGLWKWCHNGLQKERERAEKYREDPHCRKPGPLIQNDASSSSETKINQS